MTLGSGFLTNVSIIGNYGNTGNSGFSMSDPSGYVAMQNTIVSGNTGASVQFGYREAGRGHIIDNGYNIISGSTQYYSFTNSTDWLDSSSNGTFTKYGSATTGQLYLDDGLSVNDNTSFNTNSWAITNASSIAVNNGTTTDNACTTTAATVTMPTTDQRGASRNGATDIGAFEFDGGDLPAIAAPTVQSLSIVTSSVQYNKMTVTWTVGNGSRRVLFGKQASSGTASPVDGTRYAANPYFGAGEQIGSSGWYALIDGAVASTTVVSGLAPSTDYIFQAFEYNGVGTGASVYLTSTSTNNPLVQQTYTPTTRYVNATSGSDTTGDGTVGSPYQTFHKAYSSSSPGDTIDANGTFDWTSSSETGDAATTGYTIGKDLIIRGHGANQTIFQAASTAASASARVFTVSGTVTSTFSDLTIRYGNVSDYGGGILSHGTTTIVNSELYSNKANSSYGGAIGSSWNTSSSTITVINCAIYNNFAYYGGGGIYFYSTSTKFLTVTNSTITNNSRTATTGDSQAAGIYVQNGSGSLTNVTIANNYGNSGASGFSMNDILGYVAVQNTLMSLNGRVKSLAFRRRL